MKNCLIILNYNDAQSCLNLVNKIEQYKNIDKIILVDNLSTDDSYSHLLKLQNSKIDVIQTNHNGGYSYGNNYGCFWAINKYSPDYLTICNPDIYFEEDVLEELISIMNREKEKFVSAISCQMNCESTPNLLSTWKLPKYSDCILNNLTILRKIIGDRTIYRKNELNQTTPVKVDVLAGSFFIIRSKAFTSVKGFDDSVFLYNEENILSKKLKEKGWSNLYLNYLSYDHYHSISINKSFSSEAKKLDLAYKSRLIYCEKYLKINKIKKIFFVITYKIGKFNYLVGKFIQRKLS
ncbi:glycosyltransferase family 2 protein [Faecalitalea cylindroides]|uniref:glycosyltransferase family 2 protein n=1 Tax=Faecalitalea cylindroides TaxID=39483 RepID=UPI0039940A0F